MDDVVIVVVPLSVVARAGRPEEAGGVVVVLQHQMNVTAGVGEMVAHAARQFVQDMLGLVIDDGVDGIEAKAVEAVFLQPIQRVMNIEVAHSAAGEIDGGTPRGVFRGIEERARIGVQIVPLRPEMVIDHVQKHHQAAPVGGLDQPLQVIRRAVGGVRREQGHAVIAPVPASRKVRDRHQFDGRDPQRGQMIQARLDAREGALGRDRAGVQFIQNGFMPGPAAPIRVRPGVRRRVGDLARPMGVEGLAARGGIGHGQPIGQAIAVQRAGTGLGYGGRPPAVALGLHRMAGVDGEPVEVGAGDPLQGDGLDVGCPQAESDAALGRMVAPNGMSWRARCGVMESLRCVSG